ncbi:60S ribosomal protein L18a [Striga asiatica]|uniref:60S ribosomal protein L18a n=1 Tax=Striga asiatica TaxID=4170 RepID=A0A5A7PN60_STRAF|nr:60S ribosomal protein L18a [Striga asiatica]
MSSPISTSQPNPRSALPPPPPPPPPQPFAVIANTARHPDRITPNASIAKYSTPLSRSIQPVHPKPRGRPARKSLGQTEQTSFTVSPVPGDRKSFADRGRRAPYRMKLWATNEVRAKSKSCLEVDLSSSKNISSPRHFNGLMASLKVLQNGASWRAPDSSMSSPYRSSTRASGYEKISSVIFTAGHSIQIFPSSILVNAPIQAQAS